MNILLIIIKILCIKHQIVIKRSWDTCLSVPWYDRLHREARVSDARRNEHMGYCSFLGAKSGAFKKTGYFRRKCPCWEANPVLLTIDRLFNHHSKSSLTICLLYYFVCYITSIRAFNTSQLPLLPYSGQDIRPV